MTADKLTQFDYLLNAYTHAAQADRPADHGYRDKRQALFAYVRDMERRAASPQPQDGWLPIEQAPRGRCRRPPTTTAGGRQC